MSEEQPLSLEDLAAERILLSATYPSLSFEIVDDALKMTVEGSEEAVSLGIEDERWLLWTTDWHGHFDCSHDAFEIAMMIFGGRARTAQESRGDRLSATWIEVFDGEYYEARHISYFLNPLERDSWRLLPGEKWYVERTHRRLLDTPELFEGFVRNTPRDSIRLGEVVRMKSELEKPRIVSDDIGWVWYENRFGPPLDGMRWTCCWERRLCLQAPYGWRTEEADSEVACVQHISPDNSACLRIVTRFRDCAEPADQPLAAVGPVSIEHIFEDPCEHSPNTRADIWTLLFSNKQEEMLAHLFLYQKLESETNLDPIRELIDRMVPLTQFVTYDQDED